MWANKINLEKKVMLKIGLNFQGQIDYNYVVTRITHYALYALYTLYSLKLKV